jgi:DNA repair exonuclease SbcCD ATPase subunit
VRRFPSGIGPNWLNAKDERGRRRFDNPDDYVTIEIAAALARNIRVIPVLVDGASIPKADKLPDSLKPLVRRNAVEIRNTQFGRDAEALVNKIREAIESARPVTGHKRFLPSTAAWLMAPGQWRTVAGGAIALLLVGWIGLYQMGVPVWVPWTPKAEPPPSADKANMVADAEQQRLKDEVERQAKVAADAEEKLKAAEAEQQRLRDEVERQTKVAADAEAKLKAAEVEQQRLAGEQKARAAADVDAKRKAAEVEQQRLKDEVERQAKAAAEAEAKQTAVQVEQQRLAALKAEEERLLAQRTTLPQSVPTVTRGPWDGWSALGSGDECEEKRVPFGSGKLNCN